MAETELQRSQTVQDLTAFAQGRFRIRRQLGKGGMGEVYLAEDTKLKRDVALKLLTPRLKSDQQYRRLLLKEAQRASGLNDPHIAQIYDVLEERDEIVLVMEYIEGTTLRQRMRQPISLNDFLDIALQCAQGLALAHAKGLLHGDIKPENIMLTAAGRVKILDFGVARRLPRSEQATTALTRESEPDQLRGTPAYMAPEVLLEKKADARADIFALGVVFYEMLAPGHPFLAGSFMGTSNRILYEHPAPLIQLRPQIPPELSRLIAEMLAKEPDQRYRTAAELAAEFRGLAASVPSVGAPPGRPKPRLWAWKFNRTIAAISLFIVLLFGVGYRMWHQRRSDQGRRGTVQPPVIQSITILPFRRIGGSPTYDYFGVGLAEVLNAKLTNARFLEVRSPHAFGNIDDPALNPLIVGQRLGVDAVLSGSYQIEAGMLSFNYTLTDVRDNVQIAGNTFQDSFTRAIALEQQLAAQIVDSLRVSASPEERKNFEASPTQQDEAFQAYLRANYEMGQLWKHPGPAQLGRVEQYLNQALQVDPHFTLALLSLARLHWVAAFWGYASPNILTRAEEEAEHAIERDPRLGDAYATRALVEFQRGRLKESRASLSQAFARSPHSALAYYVAGFYYTGIGLPDRSLSAFRRARELDPELVRRELGLAYRYAGDLTRAEEQLREDLQAHAGDLATAGALATVLVARGDLAGAQELTDDLERRAPADAMVQYLIALLRVAKGKPFSIPKWLERYQEIYWSDPGYCANVAGVYALAQEPAQALRWLRRASELTMRNYPFVLKNPLYANLQKNHDFQSYLESLRQQWLEEERRETEQPLIPATNP